MSVTLTPRANVTLTLNGSERDPNAPGQASVALKHSDGVGRKAQSVCARTEVHRCVRADVCTRVYFRFPCYVCLLYVCLLFVCLFVLLLFARC